MFACVWLWMYVWISTTAQMSVRILTVAAYVLHDLALVWLSMGAECYTQNEKDLWNWFVSKHGVMFWLSLSSARISTGWEVKSDVISKVLTLVGPFDGVSKTKMVVRQTSQVTSQATIFIYRPHNTIILTLLKLQLNRQLEHLILFHDLNIAAYTKHM